MKFSVKHRTAYTYSKPVRESYNDARLCPISDDFQLTEGFTLSVVPKSASILRRLDFYLNQVHHFEVIEMHQHLEVVSNSTVETYIDSRNFSVTSNPSQLASLSHDEKFYDFLTASERVVITPMIIHEAKEIVPTIDDVQAAVLRLMEFVFKEFTYAPNSTAVETSVVDVWKNRCGVCQDFAHMMIAFCRALGIPARYVSGYFYVEPSAHLSALDDNTQSHAWVECYLPGIGWVGYDPTHNRKVNEVYIKVAIGRDYCDVRPLAGTFVGAATAEMEVSVRIDCIT